MQSPVSDIEPFEQDNESIERDSDIEWQTVSTPLTIKQMWRASKIHSDAPFTLDGREIKWVYCVGHIVDIDDRDTFYMIRIDDGSAGLLTAFLWKKEDQHYWRVFADLLEKGMIGQNMYARVSGELRGSKGYKNSITARSVVPVKDSYEIFFHLFECVSAAQNCKKLLTRKEKEAEQPSSSDAPGPLSTRLDGEASSKGEKDKDEEEPPLDIEISAYMAVDESSDEELENVTDPGHPDDSSDEGGGEKDLENLTDSDSEESEHAQERTETVETGDGAKTQASSEPATEPDSSAEELRQMQESLQVLSLTSTDDSNNEDPVKSDSQDMHGEPTPFPQINDSAQEPDQAQEPLQTTNVTPADRSDDANVAKSEAPAAHDESTPQSRIISSASSAQELNQVQELIQTMNLSSVDRSNDEGASKSELSEMREEPASESHTPQDPLSKLTNAQRALILHMTQRRDEVWEAGEEEWTGMHISEMARVLKRHKNMSAAEIAAAVDDLIETEYILSTVDETHFDVRDS